MTTQFNGENRPEASHGAEGEVVTRGISKSPLEKFAERIRKRVKEAFNIHINKKLNKITLWIGDIFVELDPRLEEDSELIYTSIELAYYTDQLKPLARLHIGSTVIELEDEDRTLIFKYTGEIEEDPRMLCDEEGLFEYLNELTKISDYEEFLEFAEDEFKNWSGLD